MRQLVLIGLWTLCTAPALARTVTVTPADGWQPLEAAQAGDIVELAPGTYHFRVNFTHAGQPGQPITLRAQDPQNRPVFDLGGTMVSQAPGSYSGGDRGRGCWQFRGGYYEVQGIVFKNCVDHGSAGIRVVNVPGIHIQDCLFAGDTDGVTGAGEDIRISASEFDHDGDALPGDAAAHSIYIYGGTLDVRFSYFHDSPHGQHFHVRSRDATLAYNWFENPGSYTGDLMTCEYFCGGRAGQPISQRMVLLGNVIIQGKPENPSQIIALFKDEADSVDGSGTAAMLSLLLHYNTIIGTPRAPGLEHRVVNLRNDTLATSLDARNNVITHVATLAQAVAGATYSATIGGVGNWLTQGSNAAGVPGTRFGADPGLGPDYVPQAGSPVLGLAAAGAMVPESEYTRDATGQLGGRARAGALDSGAFERTPGPASPDAGPGGADAAAADAGTAMPPAMHGGGCGCDLTGRGRAPASQDAGAWFFSAVALLFLWTRADRKSWTSKAPRDS